MKFHNQQKARLEFSPQNFGFPAHSIVPMLIFLLQLHFIAHCTKPVKWRTALQSCMHSTLAGTSRRRRSRIWRDLWFKSPASTFLGCGSWLLPSLDFFSPRLRLCLYRITSFPQYPRALQRASDRCRNYNFFVACRTASKVSLPRRWIRWTHFLRCRFTLP